MKFLIIFTIAFLAVTANSSPIIKNNKIDLPISYELDEFVSQSGIIQTLIKLIQDLIKTAQKTLQDILDKLETLLHSINDRIQKIIDEAKENIDRIANGAVDKLEEIAKENELSKQCVANHRPELDVVLATYGLEIETCRENATKQAQNIRNEIEVHVEGIRNNIDALEDIVSDCLETTGTPIKLIACIANRTNDIKVQLIDIIKNAKNAISTGPTRALEIIGDTRICIKDKNEKLEKSIEEIVAKIQECIQNGHNNPDPEPQPEPEPEPEPEAKLFM